MIRLLLLIVLPIVAPYIAWYCWKIFLEPPGIDPATGDQIVPSIVDAPRGKLLIAAVVLLFLTVGGFLIAHYAIGQDPYRPLEFEQPASKTGTR
jgi:hypothetical protein